MTRKLTPAQIQALEGLAANGKLLGEMHGSVGVRYTWQNGSKAPVPHHRTIFALRNKQRLFQMPFVAYPHIGWMCFSTNPDDQLVPPNLIK